ncbi:hypothetical protein A2U01_0078454, partial [Trifolium medium]|nr:hypothetical protein [Trifolium medium]
GDHDLSNHVDLLVEKIAADLERDEGELHEGADNHKEHEKAVEDFVTAHHIYDTETVVSPTPPEALRGSPELPVTKPVVGTTQSSEERGPILS